MDIRKYAVHAMAKRADYARRQGKERMEVKRLAISQHVINNLTDEVWGKANYDWPSFPSTAFSKGGPLKWDYV